jgi:hypothetical protein
MSAHGRTHAARSSRKSLLPLPCLSPADKLSESEQAAVTKPATIRNCSRPVGWAKAGKPLRRQLAGSSRALFSLELGSPCVLFSAQTLALAFI